MGRGKQNQQTPQPPSSAAHSPANGMTAAALAQASLEDPTFVPPPVPPSTEYRPPGSNTAGGPGGGGPGAYAPPTAREFADIKALQGVAPEKVYRLCLQGDVLPWLQTPVDASGAVAALEKAYAADPFGAEVERQRREAVMGSVAAAGSSGTGGVVGGGGPSPAYVPRMNMASPSLPSARKGLTAAAAVAAVVAVSSAGGKGGGNGNAATATTGNDSNRRGGADGGESYGYGGGGGYYEDDADADGGDDDDDEGGGGGGGGAPEAERIAALEECAAQQMARLRSEAAALRTLQAAHTRTVVDLARHDVGAYAKELGAVEAVAAPPEESAVAEALRAVCERPEQVEGITARALEQTDALRAMHGELCRAKIKFLVDEEIRIAKAEQKLCLDS